MHKKLDFGAKKLEIYFKFSLRFWVCYSIFVFLQKKNAYTTYQKKASSLIKTIVYSLTDKILKKNPSDFAEKHEILAFLEEQRNDFYFNSTKKIWITFNFFCRQNWGSFPQNRADKFQFWFLQLDHKFKLFRVKTFLLSTWFRYWV